MRGEERPRLEVGQKMWFLPYQGRNNPKPPREVEIMQIMSVWAVTDSTRPIHIKSMVEDIGNGGKLFFSEKECRDALRSEALLKKLSEAALDSPCRDPDTILQAASLLGLKIDFDVEVEFQDGDEENLSFRP